jgi:hypothetical protein
VSSSCFVAVDRSALSELFGFGKLGRRRWMPAALETVHWCRAMDVGVTSPAVLYMPVCCNTGWPTGCIMCCAEDANKLGEAMCGGIYAADDSPAVAVVPAGLSGRCGMVAAIVEANASRK